MSTTEHELVDEAEQVIQWRIEELERAGYDPWSARKLGERLCADLHRAVELVRRGCPPATAVRILL